MCACPPRSFPIPGPQRPTARAQPHTPPPQAAEGASRGPLCGGQSLCLTLVSAQGRWEAAQGAEEPSLQTCQPPGPARLALPARAHQEAGRSAGPVAQASHLSFRSSPGQLLAAPRMGTPTAKQAEPGDNPTKCRAPAVSRAPRPGREALPALGPASVGQDILMFRPQTAIERPRGPTLCQELRRPVLPQPAPPAPPGASRAWETDEGTDQEGTGGC